MAIKKKTIQPRIIEKKVPLAKSGFNLPEMQMEEAAQGFEEGQLSLDVFQTADEIIVVAPVAGVKKQDLNVAITDEVLTIKGKRNFSFKISKEDYFTQECFWGNFSRSVILPESIDTAKVKATFHDGILIVKIPKVERIKTRTIEILEE